MVRDVQHFAVTVAAGTTAANPQLTNLTMPPRTIRAVRVRIPPGPLGKVGFNLAMAGTSIIPSTAGAWYVGNDEVLELPLDYQPDSGAWQVKIYNTGTNAHTLQFTFLADIPGQDVNDVILTPLAL